MNFNVSKCCSIHFTQTITYKMENTYYLYDTPLLSLDHFKYLGITLQSNLRYDRHIQDITAKANRTLGLLRRNVRTPLSQLKERAYKAVVRPQLEYASTIWSPWQRYLVDDVEKVQRRSTRYIYNDYRFDSSLSTMIENLHWDSLETRRTKSSLVMFYKMINNLAAIPYEHYVKPIPNSTTRHSHQHKILPLSSSKNAFKFSFIPRTIPIWKLCGFVGHSASLGCSKCKNVFPSIKHNSAERWGICLDFSGYDEESWTNSNIEEHHTQAYLHLNASTKGQQKSIEKSHGITYSVLLELPYRDPIKFSVVDPMHNLFLGTGK